MGVSGLVGGECACGAAREGVEEDAEGEHEEALRDALGESAGCFGEVVFESHLFFRG